MKGKSKSHPRHPLMCWDIIAIEQSTSKRLMEVLTLNELKLQFDWEINLREFFDRPFDAVVLTDAEQKIVWVNKGFEKMTGYSATFAVGKTPKFLQGEDTNDTEKQRIRQQILLQKSVSGNLINYKKNGTPYLCQIRIFPLFNRKKQLQHFVALERELNREILI
jgi:PAS domain S-box-containing protein